MGIFEAKAKQPVSSNAKEKVSGSEQDKSTPVTDNRLSQKDAVFAETKKVIQKHKVALVKSQPVSNFLTKEHRKEIVDALVASFKGLKIRLKDTPSNQEKLQDDKKLRDYTTGLLKNWLERDKRLHSVGEDLM